MEVAIVGAGVGGLTLALSLHQAGIRPRVYEAAEELRPIGLGINLLPHATNELARLGLEESLAKVAVQTREAVFYNRFGQRIHVEALGRHAGYEHPQFSIHRGDLQDVLLAAVKGRLGSDAVRTGWRCTGVEQIGSRAVAAFAAPGTTVDADVVVACDGLHSVIRKQLHPAEGEPVYSGVNMWRGATRWKPYLTGESFVRAGWLATGKLVAYPIRNLGRGDQLVNWVVEIETPVHEKRDWNSKGRLEDFIGAFEDWRFDWLDVPAMLRASEIVLEFPMVDQDPLPWWSKGRVTLLGDAAHPMVPRGSNGAGQAILDARTLADCLASIPDPEAALNDYEAKRLRATSAIVLANRANPPDAILREVYRRTGDKPFDRIEDVISAEELRRITDGYKQVTGQRR